MAWNQTDRSFKTLINRVTTDANKKFYEELGADTINTAMHEIWIDPLSTTPSISVTHGLAQLYTLYTLTEDTSVPAQQAYNAAGLTDWISPKYGALYEVKLYDNSNNQIFPTDASQWFWDYQTGILTFNASTASFPKPFKITGYRYTGNKGRVVKDIGFAGTSGLSVYYTDGTVNTLPVTGGGGPITGPVSGLKSESVMLTLTAGNPTSVDYAALLFDDVVNAQFFEITSFGTNGTAGNPGDDTLELGLLDISVNQLTKVVTVNPDINVTGVLQLIGPGDITLVGNITNATTMARGVVQIATALDLANGNDLGSSGAILATPPSIVKNAIAAVNYLIYPPPITPYDNYGIIGNWSYDDNFIYYCVPCVAGTAGTCGVGGKVWRRFNAETW